AAVEDLHEPGEVHQRAAQSVHLVDHDAVHLAPLHRGHQPPQRRAVHVPAAVPPVVVALREQDPPLVLHGGDERLAALALGVEAVDLLLEPLLGALAGVDGAADGPGGPRAVAGGAPARGALGAAAAHAAPPSPLGGLMPKNRLPFQWLPVIALATAD